MKRETIVSVSLHAAERAMPFLTTMCRGSVRIDNLDELKSTIAKHSENLAKWPGAPTPMPRLTESDLQVRFRFERKQEAMLFKLTFGGV